MTYEWDSSRLTSRVSLSFGDRRANNNNAMPDGYAVAVGEPAVSAGKWYGEIRLQNLSGDESLGVVDASYTPAADEIGHDVHGWGFHVSYPPETIHDGNRTAHGVAGSSGDRWMIAIDMDNGYVWFGRNGTWFGSGNPATGANPAFTGLAGTISPAVSLHDRYGYAMSSFNESELTYTPPSGFKAFDDASVGLSEYIEINADIGGYSTSPRTPAQIIEIDADFGVTTDSPRMPAQVIEIDAQIGAGRERERGFDETIDISADIGAFNFSAWIRENADKGTLRFYCTLTGGQDGQDDYVSPVKNFQCRLRSGQPSYLSCVFPYSQALVDVITARPNAQVVVEMAFVVNGAETLREVIAQADFHSMRYDRGANNHSLTIAAYRTISYGGGTIDLQGVTKETLMNDGRWSHRCALPDWYLKPGCTARYGSVEYTVGTITYIVGEGAQSMDVTEAQAV